jgi:hypothetical protein
VYKKIDLGGWRSDLSRIVGHTTEDETLKSARSLKVSDTKSSIEVFNDFQPSMKLSDFKALTLQQKKERLASAGFMQLRRSGEFDFLSAREARLNSGVLSAEQEVCFIRKQTTKNLSQTQTQDKLMNIE